MRGGWSLRKYLVLLQGPVTHLLSIAPRQAKLKAQELGEKYSHSPRSLLLTDCSLAWQKDGIRKRVLPDEADVDAAKSADSAAAKKHKAVDNAAGASLTTTKDKGKQRQGNEGVNGGGKRQGESTCGRSMPFTR